MTAPSPYEQLISAAAPTKRCSDWPILCPGAADGADRTPLFDIDGGDNQHDGFWVDVQRWKSWLVPVYRRQRKSLPGYSRAGGAFGARV